MQLILESERISVDPNKKMSVLQAAASVKEHLSSDPPIIEPAKNMEVNGAIDSDDSEKNTDQMSTNETTTDNVTEGADTIMHDADEVFTDVAVNTAKGNLKDVSKVNTILEVTLGDKIGLEADSGSKKDSSENSNEEDEEPMEHLELSDNDDENDSKKSDNCSIIAGNEKDVIKNNILESNATLLLRENILIESPTKLNKGEEPMDEDILSKNSDSIEKDEESKNEEENGINKQNEIVTGRCYENQKESEETKEDDAMNAEVDTSDENKEDDAINAEIDTSDKNKEDDAINAEIDTSDENKEEDAMNAEIDTSDKNKEDDAMNAEIDTSDENKEEGAMNAEIDTSDKNKEDDAMNAEIDTSDKNKEDDAMNAEIDTSDKNKEDDAINAEIDTSDENKEEDAMNAEIDMSDEKNEEIRKVESNEEKNIDKDTSQAKVISEADATNLKDEKPLVALNFLSSFKTKITDMTRADLEEFCILKIVEGVVDRSNLSDIKAKLKTMMQNVEEWRKKAMVLNKQNRDLQIVLRTVQEEQKKRSDEIITPLKITRSVGMQVLMTENKTDPNLTRGRVQKRPVANINTPLPKTTPVKTPSQNKNIKTPIPVPRLVPALNSSPSKPVTPRASPQLQNPTITSNNTSKANTTPNGVKTYTTQKADKRSYSVSIDLTDDDPPPAKQIATGKGMQPPVRLVPSQQLMAPGHRSPLLHTKQNANPRQVYIPIGGPQGNIRPGQTIVFKTNQQNVRTRQPGPGTVVRGGSTNVRSTAPRNQSKHPAPLPQAYQQPQPPNWKALPPAPDLKISKIENGIVVSWKIDGYQEDSFEEIVSYQLYAYQETAAPASTYLWNKIGDIKALPLPMACTLTQFIAGFKYYFAVRAVDARSRIGPFSLPGSILLLNK